MTITGAAQGEAFDSTRERHWLSDAIGDGRVAETLPGVQYSQPDLTAI